jgi:hypothetical protein
MKILFIHLSDSHLKEDTRLNNINANAIINSLTEIESFDECVLVFSGDIANSGAANEYKVASFLLGRVLKGISERYLDGKHIHTLIVPGNHDNSVVDEKRNHETLVSYYIDKKTDDHFYNELGQLSNFYTFANRNLCYSRGKIIDVRKIVFGKFVIKVNLINSAPFSLLGSENGDKGMHYIPSREFNKFDFNNNENYTISIIHHGAEWFSDETKRTLYEKLNPSSDLVFVGHEHFSLNENKTINGKKQIDISSGVALYGTKTEHGYNALILNTDEGYLHGYKFIYNGSIYKPSTEPTLINNNVIFRGKYKFTHTQQFKSSLESDIEQRDGNRFLDYFVFPSLEAKNINDDLKNLTVTTEEKFIELLSIKNKISIEGSLKSGKTILSKYLCLRLSEDYVPMLLTEEDFGSKKNRNVIQYALTEQYGSEADYDEYMQLDKDKLVLIVDRHDRVKKERWNDFYSEYNSKFGHIILLCGIDWNINIKEKAIEELTENEFYYLKICPFYYGKRQELITKICSKYKEHKIVDIPERARKINEEITNQIKYFQLNPDFIHQYVNYYINFSYIKTQNESNVFNKVFEANITFRIAQNTQEENVNEILVALDFVAHYIHFNKKYPLPIEEFEQAINAYNKRYDNELNPKMVYQVAIKANIIKEVSEKFGVEFCDENLLAYFTALHLNRIFNEGKGAADLKYILDNICFEINGDIILFLSYITSNVQILYPIMTSMISLMNDWDELSIDNENIKFLTKQTSPVIKQKLPDENDKKIAIEEKTQMEKSMLEEKRKDAESLYSYDESKVNSFGNKISKSINYLELVAKILPNFRHILGGEEKQAVVEILYSYPNKLLYFMLKDIDENIDKIIDELLSKNSKTKRGLLITRDMLEKSMQSQAISYILGIFDFVASTAATGKAMTELSKFNFEQNTNYRLQNIMMEENVGNFHNFSTKAEKLFNETSQNLVKQMISLIVRKYFLYHDVVLVGNAEHLADKFFGETEKKDLQLIQAKNRIVKK